jgi:hypothetical protein
MSAPLSTPDFAGLLAPDPDRPYWHLPDGKRLSFGEIAPHLSDQERARLGEQHAQAILALELLGIRQHLAGAHSEGRRLLAACSRLCTEPLGHWPSYAATSDHS